MRLWDFAVDRYGREDARAALLALQDAHGQSIVLLLWRLWALDRDLPPSALSEAVAVARHWETTIIAPLRAARRSHRRPPVAAEADHDPREEIAARERRGEQRLCEILEGLTPRGARSGADPHDALRELAALWGEAPQAEVPEGLGRRRGGADGARDAVPRRRPFSIGSRSVTGASASRLPGSFGGGNPAGGHRRSDAGRRRWRKVPRL